MPEDVVSLFEEYTASFERGDPPDLRAFLERAGDGRDELAALVDTWLQVAPAPEPDEEAVALAQAWIAGEPPLLELRRRRGLRRADVVERLIERFSLDRDEGGEGRPLLPRGRDGAAATVAANPRGARGDLRPSAPRLARAPARGRDRVLRADAARARRLDVAEPEPWDEIDELFRGEQRA